MNRKYAIASALAAVLAATTPTIVKAEDVGKTIGDAFKEGFTGLKDGVLDAYETSTKGAKEKWNDVTGKPNEQPVAAMPAPGAMGNITTEVQAELGLAGYDPGPMDGVHGPRTADAVRRYQVDNNLPVDGQVSVAVLDHMRAKRGYSQTGAQPPAQPLVGAQPALPQPQAQAPVQQQPMAGSNAPTSSAGTGSNLPVMPQSGQAEQQIQPQAGQASAGSNCQPFESRLMIDGKPEVTHGTACLQADGTWKRVN